MKTKSLPGVLTTVETETPARRGYLITCHNWITDLFLECAGRKFVINESSELIFEGNKSGRRLYVSKEPRTPSTFNKSGEMLLVGSELNPSVHKLLLACVSEYLALSPADRKQGRSEYIVEIPLKEYAASLNPETLTKEKTFKNVKSKIFRDLDTLSRAQVKVHIKDAGWRIQNVFSFAGYDAKAKTMQLGFLPFFARCLEFNTKTNINGDKERAPALLGLFPFKALSLPGQNPNPYRLTNYLFKRLSSYGNQARNTDKTVSVETLLKNRAEPVAPETLKAEKLGWQTRIKAKLEAELNALVEQGLLAGWNYAGDDETFTTFEIWEKALIVFEPAEPLPPARKRAK